MTKHEGLLAPAQTTSFDCSSHSGLLLAGLQGLRHHGQLLDVTLRVGGHAFLAHKIVLASCSDYFRAMFTDAMKESRMSEITLAGVTADGMRLLLDYMYTARVDLTLGNIQDILSAASHLQLVSVVEACSIYLQSQIDLDNAVDIATLAETYSLKGLRHEVYRYMSSQLRQLASSGEVLRLSPAQITHLLTCDFPVDCTEAEVLDIVIKWSKGQSSNVALKVLRYVNYQEIPMVALNTALLTVDPYLSSKLSLELRPHEFRRSETALSSLVNSRGMELAIVKVGGFGLSGVTNEVTYYLASAGKWQHLTKIPHIEQCNFGTAVLDNKLYVVGGCCNLSLLPEDIHPFGFSYCGQENKWYTIAPMHTERCRFSLNVVQGRLYAVGGNTEEDEARVEEVSLCESYDPSRDAWDVQPSAPGHRTQHAAAAWPSVAPHSLFVSGGLDRELVLTTVQCFDTRTGVWEDRAPMLTPRADHVMLTIGNYVYVCGGWGDDDDGHGARILIDTIDRYDVEKDLWETVGRMPNPRYHSGIVAVHDKIYFIGGFHSDALFDRATDFVDCYSLGTNSWTSEDRYPGPVWEHGSVTMYVPRCRNDMPVLPMLDIL